MTSTKGHPEVLKANINAPHLEKSEYVLKELIGDATEAVAFVNGHACLALLDTGSQVTSIAKSFYDRHLFNQPIEPIENIVRVVGAGGQEVPFLGYVTMHVSFPDNDVGIRGTLTTLALVMPYNSYNQRVPVIIGTNLVKQCRMHVNKLRARTSCKLPKFHLLGNEYTNSSSHRIDFFNDKTILAQK